MWKRYLPYLILLLVGACSREPNAPTQTTTGDPDRGRSVYLSNCAACHNSSDPSRDGPVGPAVKGSSRDLLEARVLKATYPPGYTPKRKTSAMPAQPYLKSSIPDLAAFLR